GPGEQADVRAAVSWAAQQRWSDGRVGMIGHSYDGFAAVMALAQRLPLAATVLMAPAIDLYRGAYMNGVPYVQTPAVTAYYQAFALIPPLSGGEAATAITGRNLSCSAGTIAQSQNGDPGTPFWRERDVIARAAG